MRIRWFLAGATPAQQNSQTNTPYVFLCRRGEPWYSCVCRIAMYHPAPPKTYLQIHMYHPFTSKASLFPATKKIMVWYICIFFLARTRFCTRVYIIYRAACHQKKIPRYICISNLAEEGSPLLPLSGQRGTQTQASNWPRDIPPSGIDHNKFHIIVWYLFLCVGFWW
jgi:hypothetical protein